MLDTERVKEQSNRDGLITSPRDLDQNITITFDNQNILQRASMRDIRNVKRKLKINLTNFKVTNELIQTLNI